MTRVASPAWVGWLRAEVFRRWRPELIGGLVAAALVGVAVFTYRELMVAHRGSHQTETLVTAEQLALRVAEWTESRTRSLQVLRAYVESEVQPDAAAFERHFSASASAYLSAFPNFQALNWVDAEGHIRIVVPLEGNEAALGQWLYDNPDQGVRAALRRAAETGEISRTNAGISLYQGGRGFAVYMPVGVDQRLGFINAVFRVDALLDAVLSERRFTSNFDYRLLESSGEVVVERIVSPAAATAAWVAAEVDLIDRPARLLIRRAASGGRAVDLVLIGGALLLGLLAALVIGALVAVGLRRHVEVSASRERYAALFRDAPHAYLTADAGGRVRAVNQALEQLTGQPADALRGTPMLDLFAPGPRGRERAAVLLRQFADGAAIRNERLDLLGAAQSRRVVMVTVERDGEPWQGGECGTRSALVDVTALDAAETAIANREAWLRALLDCAPVGILFVASDGAILTANRRAVQLLERPSGEILGEPFWRYFQPGRHWRTDPSPRESLRDRTGALEEWCLLAPNGNTRRIRVGIGATEVIGDAPGGWVCTVQDLSEIEQLEARLQQAQRMESVGTLAGGIAHDFNNLLQVISTAAESLAEAPGQTVGTESVELIRRSAGRASELVSQLLQFSRRQTPVFEPTDLRQVMEEGIRMLRGAIPAHVSVTSTTPDTPVMVDGSATLLLQVVVNLGVNAFQALEAAGGTLSLSLESDREMAVLRVEDDGPGMTAAVKEHIFDPFYTTKAPGDGSGLGLAMVHGTITSHSGVISVWSEPGAGARFEIRLPLLESQESVATRVPDPVSPQSDGQRVMLVDDEEMVLATLARGLRRRGLEVLACSSAEEALSRLADRKVEVDAIVSDYSMPAMRGDEFLRRVAQLRPGIHRVLCSGYHHGGRDLLEVAHVVLDKPVSIADLAAAILGGIR